MRHQRAWQVGLSAVLLAGALQLLHMLVDVEAMLAFRAELFGIATGEEVAADRGLWPVLPMMVAGFITILLGWLLIWRAFQVPAARAFIAFVIFWQPPFFWLAQTGLMTVESVAYAATIVEVASMVPLVLFAMWFPRPLTQADLAAARAPRKRGRIRTALGWPWRRLRAGLLRPRVFVAAAAVALIVTALGGAVASFVFFIPALCLAVSYLRAGFLVADEDGKRRSLWIVNGFSLAAWLIVLAFAVIFAAGFATGLLQGLAAHEEVAQPLGHGWLTPMEIVYALAWLSILISIAAAILYRGALSPGLVLRKTSLYGALGVCLAFLFAALENILSGHVAIRLGLPASTGGWLAGGLVALTIGPLRRRIERRTDRVIDRLVPPATPAEGKRRQSVAVFSELSGLARLAAADPDSASTAASLLHRVAQRTANRFRGRLVGGLADGVLLEFPQATDAVQAATFAAESFAAAAEALELPPLHLTSGIHAAVAVDGAHGESSDGAIDIAARIGAEAAPGEVWISSAVAELLRDEPGAPELVPVAMLQLAGVPPVECYRSYSAIQPGS